ncbi:hypothetical protein VNO77_04678 [Canavalia gladiata]|uniref:H15 domain-containing protein n=1 Tax=Canavalia gladiata TaxID=3824 RepID=A0AAN9MXK5_CANGL
MTTEDPLLRSSPSLSLDQDSRTTRIMDSLISQLSQLHPSVSIHSSLIQRHLRPVFDSFHTPTHPPYALMIRRAIMELNEGSGSTEKAISEFIKREYDDLPWAHVKILGLHLRKLCEVEELVCAEGGRYKLLPDREETKQCRGNKKGKRGKRRSNHGDGKRKVAGENCEVVETERDNGLQKEGIKEQIQVSELDVASTGPSVVVERAQKQGEQAHKLSIGRDEESEKGGPEVIGQQSQHAEAEALVQRESEESQIQLCHKSLILRRFVADAADAAPIAVTMQLDSIPHLETIGSSQLAASNCPIDSQQPLLVPISEGLPKYLPAAGVGLSPAQLHLQGSCLGHSESNLDATARLSGLLLSSSNVQEQEQDENPMSVDPEHQHPNHQYGGRRPRKCKKIVDYQEESLLPSGSLSPAELQLQMSCHRHSESSLDAASRVAGSLSLNAREHKQDENPVCGDPEHRHPSYQCGESMPCKCKTAADHQAESLLPSGDTTAIKQKPNVMKIDNWWLSQSQGQDIDRGRHPKLHRNVHHINKKIQPPDQPEDLVCAPYSSQKETRESLLPLDDDIHNKQKSNINKMEKQQQYNRGRDQGKPGQGRGRGRPGQGRGRGRPPKLIQNQNAEQFGEQLQQEHHAKQQGQCRGRSRGSPPKPNGNTIQYEEQSQQEDQALPHGQGRCRGRPPKPNQNVNKCEAHLQQKVQAQQQRVRDRGRGRPPKINQNTNQCEEQLQLQDHGLVNSANSWGNDSQSLDLKQLHVQSHREHHKSELGEAKPLTGLSHEHVKFEVDGDAGLLKSEIESSHQQLQLEAHHCQDWVSLSKLEVAISLCRCMEA